MAKISDLLLDHTHRPWSMPKGKWQFYQEWNDALFLHFEVNYDTLRALIPEELELDDFQGSYFVSIVAFQMEKIRPRNLPYWHFVSTFREINMRTYIKNNNKQGVYFLSIEAEKPFSTWVSKTISGLPYELSKIVRKSDSYTNVNLKKSFKLDAHFRVGEKIQHKTALELWITERYCLYIKKKTEFHRYEIHHPEWILHKVDGFQLELNYRIGGLYLNQTNLHSAQYSPGVQVVSWPSQNIRNSTL